MKGNRFPAELGNPSPRCPLVAGIMGRTRKEAAAHSPPAFPGLARGAQPGLETRSASSSTQTPRNPPLGRAETQMLGGNPGEGGEEVGDTGWESEETVR